MCIRDRSYNEKIYIGGPVSQAMVFYLYRSTKGIDGLDEVCPGVYFGSSLETLESLTLILQTQRRIFVFIWDILGGQVVN